MRTRPYLASICSVCVHQQVSLRYWLQKCQTTMGINFILSLYLSSSAVHSTGVYQTLLGGSSFLFLLTNLPKKLPLYLLRRYCPQNVSSWFNDTFESFCKGLVVPDKMLVGSICFKAPKFAIINSLCCLMLACYVLDIQILTVWAQWEARQWAKRRIWSLCTPSINWELQNIPCCYGRSVREENLLQRVT